MDANSQETSVKNIQIDGLVVLRIIKHCEEDSGGPELVQGVLLGLVVGDTLEITNCFPFPRTNETSDFDEVQYQMDMMRSLRHVNIDHLHVGWYQSSNHGNFINRAFLDSQFSYQSAIEESIVLIFDPIKTSQGYLSLKAYRLTPKMMEMYKAKHFSYESVKKEGLAFNDIYEEVPIRVKNSPLINMLLLKLKKENPIPEKVEYLNLSHSSSLERQLHLMMSSVDEVTQEGGKFVQYQRSAAKQHQNKLLHVQRRQTENAARTQRGEPPLPEEDASKLFKPVPQPPRIDALLAAGQVSAYCDKVCHYSSQTLGRIFMAQALDNKD
uniref:Eukaryotic translation initiation factor 3 subunit H n=1 Tax=Phallusia mammillata TaxID=59560 RepID=A0A6F9DCF3_9ASCI|nr:eukaryotic translation initiation factor 3 subunit H [Phallusia mammillata]